MKSCSNLVPQDFPKVLLCFTFDFQYSFILTAKNGLNNLLPKDALPMEALKFCYQVALKISLRLAILGECIMTLLKEPHWPVGYSGSSWLSHLLAVLGHKMDPGLPFLISSLQSSSTRYVLLLNHTFSLHVNSLSHKWLLLFQLTLSRLLLSTAQSPTLPVQSVLLTDVWSSAKRLQVFKTNKSFVASFLYHLLEDMSVNI